MKPACSSVSLRNASGSVTENITIQEVVLQIYPRSNYCLSDLPIVLYSSGDHLGVERTIPVKNILRWTIGIK